MARGCRAGEMLRIAQSRQDVVLPCRGAVHGSCHFPGLCRVLASPRKLALADTVFPYQNQATPLRKYHGVCRRRTSLFLVLVLVVEVVLMVVVLMVARIIRKAIERLALPKSTV